MPPVRLRMSSELAQRIRSWTSRNSVRSRLALPEEGSRTCTCTIAAPAACASSAAAAICCGVTGTCGFLPTESPEPVTAHVTKTASRMDLVIQLRDRRLRWAAHAPQSHAGGLHRREHPQYV